MVGQMIQCSVQVCLNLIKIFLTNTSTVHYKEESYRHSLFYLWSACWVQQRVVEGEDFPLYKLDRYRYVQHWSVWFLSLIWGRVKFVHSGQQHVMIFEGNYFYHCYYSSLEKWGFIDMIGILKVQTKEVPWEGLVWYWVRSEIGCGIKHHGLMVGALELRLGSPISSHGCVLRQGSLHNAGGSPVMD